jgi:hypothetical protein
VLGTGGERYEVEGVVSSVLWLSREPPSEASDEVRCEERVERREEDAREMPPVPLRRDCGESEVRGRVLRRQADEVRHVDAHPRPELDELGAVDVVQPRELDEAGLGGGEPFPQRRILLQKGVRVGGLTCQVGGGEG